MKLPRKTSISLLVATGCILPLVAFQLGAVFIPGFDMEAFYLPPPPSTLPHVRFTLIEQVAICLASFGLKPLYELVTLILVIRLWNRTDEATVALRYGLIAFFLGENSCALNYLLFDENSFLLEYLHTYGMLVCFSFICYALLKAIDRSIFKYTIKEQHCAFMFFCKRCYKHHPISCTIRRFYQLFIAGCIIIACMPMTASLGGYHVVGDVFGADVVFGHSLAQQILENRLWPSTAIIFLGIAFFVLHLKKEHGFETAKLFLSAGLGMLGFSLMRFFVFQSFRNTPIRADFWEELTESLFIFIVYYVLFSSREKHGIIRRQ